MAEYHAGDPVVKRFVQSYLPRICAEWQLGNADEQHVIDNAPLGQMSSTHVSLPFS